MRSRFINDLLSVGLSRFGVILFGIGKSIITARYLGPENNGLIAALSVYPTLFMSIGSLGISQAVTYFVGRDLYNLELIKRSITQIWFFSTLISILSCYVLIRYFSSSGDNSLLVVLAIIPIPFNLFINYNQGIFLGQNKIKTFNKINWLPQFVIFFATVLFVVVIDLGLTGAMLAAIFGPLLMMFILLSKNDFLKSFSFRVDAKPVRALFSLGIIYALSLLVINLNYKVDIIIMDKLSTPFQLGIYSKGAQLIEYLWQIPMLMSTIIFARSANSSDPNAFSLKVAQLLRLSVIAIGIAMIILVLLSEWLIVLMFGQEFVESSNVLNVLLPGILLMTIFKVLNMDLAGKGKPWISLKAMVPSLLLNIALNILLVPKFGAYGASLSSTFTYSLASILFLHFYSKEVNIPIKVLLRYRTSDFKPILALLRSKS